MAKSKKDKAGWVIISRSILESSIWTSSEPFSGRDAWIDLILTVNHEDREIITRSGEVVKIPRGATWTSIRKLMNRWHWSSGKVRRYLGTLTGAQMITLNGTPDGTLLTLVNYSNFQGPRHTERNAERLADGHTGGIRTTMNNNEQQKNNRSGARPVSMADTIAALERYAKQGGETA